MNVRAVMRLLAIAALLGVVGTCKDGTDPPRPGWLVVTLTTPNADDGGVLFTVSGGQIDSVRSQLPTLLHRSEGAAQRRVVVAGNLGAGKIAEIWVPDTRATAQYSATLVEAASRSFVQRAVGGYSIAIVASQ